MDSNLEQLLKLSSFVFAKFDPAGTVVEANPAFYSILGLDPNSSYNIANLLRPEDEQEFIECTEFTEKDLRLRHEDGSFKWFKIAKTCDQDGCSIIAKEFTDHKLEMNKIRFQELLFKNIVNSIPLAITCKNVADNGKYLVWNEMAEKLFQTTAEKAIGKSDFDLMDAEAAELIKRKESDLFHLDSAYEQFEEDVQIEGQTHHFYTFKIPLKNSKDQPQFLIKVTLDQTQDVKDFKNQQMEQARSLQAAKMATLSEMSGGVAHEINNPLAIIYSIAGRLEISANKNKLEVEAVKKATASLLKASERIATIIRGLRSFARDASNDPFKADSIKSIIDTALEFCSTRFKNHNVDLRISQVPEELTVECRATEISQALLNLLSNSLDAVEKQEGEHWIAIEVKDLGDEVEVAIVDSGKGIPAAIIDKISQPFVTTKQVGAGPGLGLAIVNGIIYSHNGTFYYDKNSPNTRFCMKIPKKQNHSEAEAA